MSWSALMSPMIALIRPAAAAVFDDLSRRRRVGRIFSGEAPSRDSPHIKKALRDLEIIFGHAGLVTTHVDQLLKDIHGSGFLSVLARDAFFNIDDPGVRFHFETIFARAFQGNDLGGELNSICDDTYKSIRLVLRESIRDQMLPSLLFLIDVHPQGKDLQKNNFYERARPDVDKALANLRPSIADGISAYISPYATRDHDGFKSGLNQRANPSWLYLQTQLVDHAVRSLSLSLAARYKFLPIEGPSGKSQLCDIDQIGILPRLKKGYFLQTELRIDTRDLDPDLDLSTVTALGPVSVVLGDPGGGKSTLAQLFCYHTMKNADSAKSPRLAFKVEVRRFQNPKYRGNGSTFTDFLIDELKRQADNISIPADIASIVLRCLVSGKATIVFDGIDEIISSSSRREIIIELSRFCSIYSHNLFVITCRSADFRVTPIPDFPIYVLQPFSVKEIGRHYRNVSHHVFRRSGADLLAAEKRFLAEAFQNAPEFITNPLLLALIVWLFNLSRRVPDNRLQIYSECSELLFNRWDALRDIDPEIPDKHWLFRLVTYLARCMYLLGNSGEIANVPWLRDQTEVFFRKVYAIDAENRARLAADRFVGHLVGRSWILQERVAGVFEFTHRTFMEYFFARHMDDEYREIDALFEHLEPRILAGEWSVSTHLAFQMKVLDKFYNTERLAKLCIQLTTNSNDGATATRSHVTDFILATVQYLQPAESDTIDIVKALVGSVDDVREWHNLVPRLMQTPAGFRQMIAEGACQRVEESIASDRTDDIWFVLDWMRGMHLRAITKHLLNAEVQHELYVEMRALLARRLSQLSIDASLGSATAKAVFDATGIVVADAIGRHGLSIWRPGAIGQRRFDWSLVDCTLAMNEICDLRSGAIGSSQAIFVKLFSSLVPSVIHQKNLAPSGTKLVRHGSSGDVVNDLAKLKASCGGQVEFVALALALIVHAELGREKDACKSSGNLLRGLLGSGTIQPPLSDYVRGWLDSEFRMFRQENGAAREIELLELF